MALGGSARLIDALVAWGDEAAIAERLAQHRQAGADHICIQVLDPDFRGLPLPQWRRLAAIDDAPAPALAVHPTEQ